MKQINFLQKIPSLSTRFLQKNWRTGLAVSWYGVASLRHPENSNFFAGFAIRGCTVKLDVAPI
jgi:hypothetical protein